MNIGFMQGRLVDRVDGKIQAFPWEQWRLEFPRARAIGLGLMEWTLDDERLYDNPFMTPAGRKEIQALGAEHGVRVASLTGDCFMQAPFWKAEGAARSALLDKLDRIVDAASQLGVGMIVLPLVDHGSLDTPAQRELVLAELNRRAEALRGARVRIVFETDYGPRDYAEFLRHLPADVFGVNYDIGNSASLGFVPREEFAAYGERIVNVHVKDRVLGGTTVPLGTGNADLPGAFAGLAALGYDGNYILQTARAVDDDHAGALARYAQMTRDWIAAAHGSRTR